MRFLSILLILVISSYAFNRIADDSFRLMPKPSYPKWLMKGNFTTNQTSGIAYIGESEKGRTFLIADDIGAIHRMYIDAEDNLDFFTLAYSKEAEAFLSGLPKADFEELAYDSADNIMYLSIEGNGPDYGEYFGIFKLICNGDYLTADTITAFEKLKITPEAEFNEFIFRNIGYEGMAVDDKYLYLGLEGVVDEKGRFLDSTYIYIVSKEDLTIRKKVGTKDYGIHTICGLYADSARTLIGVDRNQRKIFKLWFDNKLNINNLVMYEFQSVIPGYPQLSYNASIESVAGSGNNTYWFIDDPWLKVFMPDDSTVSMLDAVTVLNFRKGIPIIYSFIEE